MKVVSYPGCCTAKILIGFGQEVNAGWDARTNKVQTVEEMKEEVDKLIRGYMIGKHNGIVSACLTSRQTRGIQALTELGFHSSGAKQKTGHRESDLYTFYTNPIEYIEANPQAYRAVRLIDIPEPKRLVKDLNDTAKRAYNALMRDSRHFMIGSTHYERYRQQAKHMLTIDANFS